ncbi:hypothetical protein D3C80_1490010 [compost metagenome]
MYTSESLKQINNNNQKSIHNPSQLKVQKDEQEQLHIKTFLPAAVTGIGHTAGQYDAKCCADQQCYRNGK